MWRALLLLLSGCGLTSALTYPSAGDGDAENVVVAGELAYAALARSGLGVVDLDRGKLVTLLAPPSGSERVDDLAVADGLLFTLDADAGRLTTWSLSEARRPRVVSAASVAVGPFSGVSAGGGRVVVSGGTSALSVHGYARDGGLAREASLEVARGQPDVLIAPDGRHAYVSTHFETTVFGLTVLELAPLKVVGRLVLDGAGFSAGGSKPANFPLVGAFGRERLYLAHGAGLAVIDVHDPAAPRLVTTLALGTHAVHLAVDGARAVVVGAEPSRLVWLDVSAADAPVLVSHETLSRPARGVALSAKHVALAAGADGVIVLPR